MNKKQARLQAIENQIKRLQRRITILNSRSNRYSWIRVAIFFIGLSLSILAYFPFGWPTTLAGIIITLIIFNIVAYYHRKIDRSLNRHRIWLQIKLTQIARITLDWNNIPPAPSQDRQTDHPFEIDLDITGNRSLLQLLNTSTSYEGTQRLRNWLLNTTPDLQVITQRQALIQEFTPRTTFRDKLLMKSLLASRNITNQWEGKKLLNWLDEQHSPKSLPALMFISLSLSLLTILLYLLTILAQLPGYWIIALLINILFLFTTQSKRGNLFEDTYYVRDAFAQLSTVFEYLETYRYSKNSHLQKLCEPFFSDQTHRPSKLLKKITRLATAATLRKNLLIWVIINVLLPWDFYIAYRFNQYKSQLSTHLLTWLNIWFELEALNSLANFAYLNPDYVLPEIISEENQSIPFCAHNLGHPLIPEEKKIVNDFTINNIGEIDIITGSNMSGKSTFLRTLGINLCLAYAGGPINATSLQTHLFRLFTCIRISDSVTENYSYFYAEVRRLKALLTAVEQPNPQPLFFLIDEIFRGTNNRERLIGSRSYISALVNQNCLGLIATHDLELVKLANTFPEIINYHFREDVIDGSMVFDYILRPGPSPTTNALKIMQMEGLPIALPKLE